MIIILPVTLAVLAGVWSVTRDRQYVVNASLIQKGADTRVGGSAAALAQQFGMNLGGDRPSESPMFYMDLLRSNALLRKAVEATYEVPRETGPWRGTLIEYWNVQPDGAVPAWLGAVDRLRDGVSPAVNRETGVLVFSVKANHPQLAEQIANKLLDALNEFILEVRQGRALDEGRFISSQVADAEKKVLAAEDALEAFLRSNRQYQNAPELMLRHDRLQRTVLMRQEVYTSALRSQEQARIDAIRNTPLFTVIDRPNDSAIPQSRGTIIRTLSAFIIGLLLSLVIAVVREFAKRRGVDNPGRDELRRLFNEVLGDVRRPSRWMRRVTAPGAASGD
jgi:capsular polysaccharide biosynthesis protein